jgi:hypothetical protein
MVLYAYIFWLAALHAIGCGPDGDELHRLLLGMAVVAIAFSFLLPVTKTFEETHRMLRWLGVPLLLMMPFALRSIWGVASPVLLDSSGICTDLDPTWWQQAWAPLQFIAIAILAYRLISVFWSSR